MSALKEQRLRELVSSFDSLIVAFSGGVDSAYLAWVATQVLGSAALCVTADSPSYPDRHRRLALRLAHDFRLRHEIISSHEMERIEYRSNPVNRCYYCKHELYSLLSELARERQFAAIADGSNADDRGDYRPGRQAAREFGVRSPLDEVELTKSEIRELSHRAGLPTWDEPASACLSSRIPYHSEVTDEKLRMIERAEDVLRDLGFRVCRVRHHDLSAGAVAKAGLSTEALAKADLSTGALAKADYLARLELGRDELSRALEPDVRDRLILELKAIGYQHVTIDLQGYRTGSLNEGLRLRPV